MSQHNRQRPEWYGYVVLAAGVLIHLCLGTTYCWGNMTTYITSYLRRSHPSVQYSDTYWVYTSVPSGQALVMPFSGWLQLKVGTRITTWLGTLCVVGALLLSHFTVENGVAALVGSYGVLFGVGVGLTYTCPVTAAISYLPEKKGLVNGIIVMGFGLGAFVMNFVITSYLNPHNCKPQCPGMHNDYPQFSCPTWTPSPTTNTSEVPDCDGDDKYFPPNSSVTNNVPNLFLLLGGIYSVMMTFGSMFIVERDRSLLGLWGHVGDGDSDEENEELVKPELQERNKKLNEDVPTLEVVKTKLGWLLWGNFLLTGVGGMFILAQYKTFGQKSSWSTDNIEAHISSAMSVGNAFGRLFHGFLSDKYGFLAVLTVSTVFSSAFQFTLSVTHISEYWFAVWCCVIAFLYGGNFSLYPAGVAQLWGKKYFPTTYAFLFTGFGVGGIVIGFVNKSLVDSIGFSGITIILGCITAVGIFNTLYIKRIVAKNEEEEEEETEEA
eukprot:TRINITY_DN8112_c0_g1_i1.p1 TRINITY_DN8112_c0_g1~~TRINITY_DN8112_c0_g1_i1.p1  ORF type:complete len:501 (+),score=72.83 TRINITY_DN8112_c0_g1_i1:29-1504(+)